MNRDSLVSLSKIIRLSSINISPLCGSIFIVLLHRSLRRLKAAARIVVAGAAHLAS